MPTKEDNIPRKPNGDIDWGTWMFEDAEAALNYRDQMLEQKYRIEQGRKDFFSGLFSSHPDLAKEKDLVQKVIDENLKELADLPVADGTAYERIAELARQKIGRETKSRERQKEYSAFKGGPGYEGASPIPDDAPQSLGDI